MTSGPLSQVRGTGTSFESGYMYTNRERPAELNCQEFIYKGCLDNFGRNSVLCA